MRTLSQTAQSLALLAVLLSQLNCPGIAMNDGDELRNLSMTTEKTATALEQQGKKDEALRLYEKFATTSEKVENQPRKIYSPYSFSLLAEFLERQGRIDEAVKWYEKIATMPVNAHAYTTKGNAMLKYAAILRKRGEKTKADKLQSEAREIIKTHKSLNDSGCDY